MMNEKEVSEVVARLLSEGVVLQEIQKVLADEYKHHITFMDLRLLSADIKVNWTQFDSEKPKEEKKEEYIPPQVDEIEVTKIDVVRAGAMYNGKFVAPSGSYGDWVIDEMGQLEVNYGNEEVTLNPEEVNIFQEKLKELLTPSM